jgi:hypothetical protein
MTNADDLFVRIRNAIREAQEHAGAQLAEYERAWEGYTLTPENVEGIIDTVEDRFVSATRLYLEHVMAEEV